jgi:hypothetical protein
MKIYPKAPIGAEAFELFLMVEGDKMGDLKGRTFLHFEASFVLFYITLLYLKLFAHINSFTLIRVFLIVLSQT